jgi:hypothetical protein
MITTEPARSMNRIEVKNTLMCVSRSSMVTDEWRDAVQSNVPIAKHRSIGDDITVQVMILMPASTSFSLHGT